MTSHADLPQGDNLVEVDVSDETLQFLIEDGSVERLYDDTYRMTEKGAAWFTDWCRQRLRKAA